MELNTGIIKSEQVQNELDTILDLFREKNIVQVTVSFGFGCGVDVDDLYVEIPIATEELKVFLEHSVAEDKYTFGSDDLYIKAEEIDAEFLLCHESDIHLETGNAEVFEIIKNRWLENDYEVFQKQGQEWQRIDQ
jgi:hypothetical protein